MPVRTVSLTLSAARDRVFNFLADIENLPRWATETCEQVRLGRGDWQALTSRGELTLRLTADATTGVIDLHAGPVAGTATPLPIRVLALGPRLTLVQFTFLQPPEQPDDRYEEDYQAHLRELRAFARRFGGGDVHASDPGAYAAHGAN